MPRRARAEPRRRTERLMTEIFSMFASVLPSCYTNGTANPPLLRRGFSFQIEAAWSNPRSGNPFFDDFGMSKDGSVVVVLPDGTKQYFPFLRMGQVNLSEIMKNAQDGPVIMTDLDE